MNKLNLKNKIALITGASSGIGRAIALNLATCGVRLLLVGRDNRRLSKVTEEATKLGSNKVSYYKANFEDEKDILHLHASIKKDNELVDILVHSAGEFASADLEDSRVKDFDRLYKVNLKAPYLLTKLFLPIIKKRRGQIVFINSSMGLATKAGVGQYASTKHGLKALADSLRSEVNKNGVRVISVFPGTTATSMQERIAKMQGRKYRTNHLLQPEDIAQIVTAALSQAKTAEVTDIMIRPFTKDIANPTP